MLDLDLINYAYSKSGSLYSIFKAASVTIAVLAGFVPHPQPLSGFGPSTVGGRRRLPQRHARIAIEKVQDSPTFYS